MSTSQWNCDDSVFVVNVKNVSVPCLETIFSRFFSKSVHFVLDIYFLLFFWTKIIQNTFYCTLTYYINLLIRCFHESWIEVPIYEYFKIFREIVFVFYSAEKWFIDSGFVKKVW